MTNSENYEIRLSPKFDKTYIKLLKKHYKKDKKSLEKFESLFEEILKKLADNPCNDLLGEEEGVSKSGDSENFEIRKIRWNKLPGLRGAASYGRIFYLVNTKEKIVELVWIYTHAEYSEPKSRPPEKELRKEILLIKEGQSSNKN